MTTKKFAVVLAVLTVAGVTTGTALAAQQTAQPRSDTLAVSAVSASPDDGHVPANAVDGNLGTRWSSKGDGAWIDYDLGSAQTVGSLAIAWYQGDSRTTTFDVTVSTDGTSWHPALTSKRTSGSTADFETYDFADVTARHVRVVGHGNTVNTWTSISETRLYGADGGGGTGGDCAVPADVLDLSNWYEGLPTGSSENPTNVKQPELATYHVDPWFTTTPDCTGVQFRAAVNGVTTSGSSYPRSELRETKGSANASWSSTSGTHTMTITEKITHLPNDKPQVVAGQIHGSDDDLTVFRLEGSSLYVTNGDDPHYKLVTSGYQLGTVFQAKFVVSGGTTKAYYNGALVATISKSYSGAYFKAGAYTQANCDKSSPCSDSNYGEVVVSGLVVTHG